jgi:hypothetical protein
MQLVCEKIYSYQEMNRAFTAYDTRKQAKLAKLGIDCAGLQKVSRLDQMSETVRKTRNYTEENKHLPSKFPFFKQTKNTFVG